MIAQNMTNRPKGANQSFDVAAFPMKLTEQDLDEVFRLKHGDLAHTGWSPRLAHRFGYFSPDDIYETVVSKLVTPETAWLDVGCGSHVMPTNPAVAQRLSERCRVLVGGMPGRS
jgi:hypothetical protein